MPEGKVGDLVRIIDVSVCSYSYWNLHDVYKITDVDSRGYYLENTRTSRYCGYLYEYRVEIVPPTIKYTRRLTVIGNGQENDT